MGDKWTNVLDELKQVVPNMTYQTWFSKLKWIDSTDGVVTLGVPTIFYVKPLSGFNGDLKTALKNNGIEVREIKYEVITVEKPTETKAREIKRDELGREKIEYKKPNIKRVITREGEKEDETGLNKRYKMENFVVGSNNDLAVSVAKNIINAPGKNYNPFFLYGGPGLGKSHLVHAVGNALNERYPQLKILYTSAYHFYDDFVNSIRIGTVKKFTQKFRKLDVLIIDDFQSIIGKEKSQEEFFNLFNDLYQQNKQIIVTSDRLPSQIKTLDERLASRLTWAGAIDLQIPNFEDRCAILKAKADFMGMEIEDEAIEYLAENIKTNIRDLEGELNKLVAMADLRQISPMTLINGGYIGVVNGGKNKNVEPKTIINIIAKYYGLTVKEMCGKSRVAHIKNARQMAMYILAEELGMSTTKIAMEVGVKDHTTVMHGVKRIKERLKLDFGLREQVANIREKIYA